MANEKDLKFKILKLLEEGKITSEEAKTLLDKTKGSSEIPESGSQLSQSLIHLPKKSHAPRNWLVGALMTLSLAAALCYYTLYIPHKKAEEGKSNITEHYSQPSTPQKITEDEQIQVKIQKKEKEEQPTYKQEQRQEQVQEESREDYKYSATNYYNVGEWANAGDLEFMIRDYHLQREKFISSRVGGDYMGWKLYVFTTIRNVSEGHFTLPYSEIKFSDGNTEDECEEGEEGVRGSASIPPGASIDRTFSKWVNGWDNLYVRMVIRKLERTADGGYERGDGKTYINILELGNLPVEN
ncbi:MAG: SHOCT-like domain-containing protein [Candidatus Pacearchaeota archaeon]